MKDYEQKMLLDKFKSALSNNDRPDKVLFILYQWIKTNVISYKEFCYLINIYL